MPAFTHRGRPFDTLVGSGQLLGREGRRRSYRFYRIGMTYVVPFIYHRDSRQLSMLLPSHGEDTVWMIGDEGTPGATLGDEIEDLCQRYLGVDTIKRQHLIPIGDCRLQGYVDLGTPEVPDLVPRDEAATVVALGVTIAEADTFVLGEGYGNAEGMWRDADELLGNAQLDLALKWVVETLRGIIRQALS
ncbi:MAG TPA: hypothetical protein VHQ86_03555 [Candidatus Saccharimonadia bacterium]|jgi:hypothetical protein|nr:hypothetical protein [Candidatus Saccharimonadia bacterium]